VPELHVDLDLAVDLNDVHPPRSRIWSYEQDVPVIVQVHDDVQVHLLNGICIRRQRSASNGCQQRHLQRPNELPLHPHL
jgi:hypothetical protein